MRPATLVALVLRRAALCMLFTLSGASCLLVMSFDDYEPYDPNVARFTITASVVGLENGVKAKLRLNEVDVELGEVDNLAPVVLPTMVVGGTSYVVGATAPGHVCPGIRTEVVARSVSVEVTCHSQDAGLVLAVSRGTTQATMSSQSTDNVVTHRALLPLLGAGDTSVVATTTSPTAKLNRDSKPWTSGAPFPIPFDGAPLDVHLEVVAGSGDKTTSHPLTVDTACTYLKPSNTRPDLQFGTSIAMSGDTLVVGAVGESSNATGVNGDASNSGASNAGAAYVFVRTDGGWRQEAYLKASNTASSALFGSSVAIFGDTVAVGAPYESSNAVGVDGTPTGTAAFSGAVYLFTRQGGAWKQQAYVKASNTRANAAFGSSAALFADTLVVGAAGESSSTIAGSDSNAPNAGAAYVFTRTNGVWRQQAYLKASNVHRDASFGASVALDGDTVAIGARQENSAATGVNGDQSDVSWPFAGAVYVFTRSGGAWSQQAYVKASNTTATPAPSGAHASFGHSVALSGDTLVVGALGETGAATGVNGDQTSGPVWNAGAAYVFTRTAGAWSQQAYLKSSNTSTTAAFGSAVAVSGNTLAVGSKGEASRATRVNGDAADVAAPEAGATFVFVRTGTTWAQRAYVKASNTRSAAKFGNAVALAGEMLAVASDGETSNATGVDGPQANTAAPRSGAVYVY